METNKKPMTIGEDEALDSAKSRFGFANAELLRDSPWARTYRLVKDHERAYLKILPDHQASILSSTVLLARYFPGHVPEVVAHDVGCGWILSADHGGRNLSYNSSEAKLRKLLKTYARFEVEAIKLPELLASLPLPQLSALPSALLDFLKPRGTEKDSPVELVGAEYFVGRSEAKRYYQTLSRRRALLERHIEPAAALPLTLNHGDLRPPNAAITANGACVLCDWDDATAGPAGMALHAMFSGCFKPTVLLSDEGAAAKAAVSDRYARRLEAYIDVLVTGGYADAATIRRALPASICAGVMQYLLNFAKYPRDSRSYRRAVERSIKRRLSDLLDLCDFLAYHERSTALEFAKDYEETGQNRRAQHLLQDYLADHPEDADVHANLARVLKKRGKVDQALATYRHALELAPEKATLHNDLGVTLMESLEIKQAKAEFRQAMELDSHLMAAQENLDRAMALDDMRHHAKQAGSVPTLRYTPEEVVDGLPRAEKLALATSLFETYGVLQVDNAFPVQMIERLHDAFIERYTSYFRKHNHPDALRLGDQRYMLTVDLEEPFNDPGLYASPLLLPVVRQLLGDDCVVGAFTSVISLPGSKNQRLHKDHPALFPSTRWHHRLPNFAVQLIVPLVTLDDAVGTLRVIKGSHKVPSDRAEKMETQDLLVPIGGCLFNDYRLSHRGLGNRSDKVRPILTIIYNRPWFRDYVNYAKQPPLRIGDRQYEQIDEDQRKLFSWWKEERKR